MREPDDPFRGGLHEAFLADEMLTVDLLYGDRECGHRTISRFIVTGDDDDQWRSGVVRHWALDCIDPSVTYHDACQPRPRGGALLRAIGRQVRVADHPDCRFVCSDEQRVAEKPGLGYDAEMPAAW